jgi:hypothetical protein
VLDQEVHDPESSEGGSLAEGRPVGGYAILLGVFAGLAGGFAAWLSRSGRELPERVAAGDLALVAVATHKAARLVSQDRVTSTVRAPFTRLENDEGGGELSETARGTGLRRAIGELLICPYCVGMWIAAAFTAGLIVAPRATRWTAAALSTLFGSDVLQIAYKKAEAAR